MNAVAELYVVLTLEAAFEVPISRTLDPTAKELELRERDIALRKHEILKQQERWEAEMDLRRAEYKTEEEIELLRAE